MSLFCSDQGFCIFIYVPSILPHLATQFLKSIQLLFGFRLHLLQSLLGLLECELGLVQINLETCKLKKNEKIKHLYLEVNFPLVTTDFGLVSLAFVGQFLFDERFQVSEERGEV